MLRAKTQPIYTYHTQPQEDDIRTRQFVVFDVFGVGIPGVFLIVTAAIVFFVVVVVVVVEIQVDNYTTAGRQGQGQ